MSYFGKNIRKIRNAKKISQAAFADLFNLTRASIGAYEEGRAEAKIDTIIEIANYYDLSLDKLLKEELTLNDIYHINTDKYINYNSLQKSSTKEQTEVENKTPQTIEMRLNNIESKINDIEKLLLKML